MRVLGVAVLIWLAMSGAVAAQEVQEPAVEEGSSPAADSDKVDGLQLILEQQQALRTEIEDGAVEGLTKREISLIRKEQATVFSVTEGKSRLQDLDINEKITLENALERINAYVQSSPEAIGKQDVCWRERTTGSKTKGTRCGTESERIQAREGARDYLSRPRVCVPPNCG